MTRLFLIAVLSPALWALFAPTSHAQNSAPSSHLVFDDNFDGDILINEVRVPKAGEATCTYYEALGWRGNGAGYAGIQAHPKAHLYIFSIWDHKEHTAPIRAVYHGPGTETVGFGGEGTGLKSWNFQLGWSTGVWYTLVARTWPVGDHTYYGFWVRAGDTKRWTHLVTMDVAATATFQGGTDAFIEDWLNTGSHARTTHLRGGWKRKTDGTWYPFRSGRYSVNSWDLAPGKRSYNYRTNWDAGVQHDATGAYYFMTAGGKTTTPSTDNPSRLAISRRATEPSYETLTIRSATATLPDSGKLRVAWEVDPTTTPPFSYQITILDRMSKDRKPLATTSGQVPHARSTTLDVAGLQWDGQHHKIMLECTDILDRSTSVEVPISRAED